MFDAWSHSAKGLTAVLAASTVWGLSPVFYKALAEVPPLEVLAHRTLWSLIFFVGVLAWQRRLSALAAALRPGAGLLWVAASAILISSNWFGFIFSVQVGRALEASLGYYIFPLFAVLMGRLVFGDRLSRWQRRAIELATCGVVVLSVGLSVPPWIALALAATFASYGVIKKLSTLGPVVSTATEVALLAPLALMWLAAVHGFDAMGPAGRVGGYFGTDMGLSLLLILSGPVTGAPLMLFSYASKRVTMGTLGLAQYVNPSLQFLVAVFLFGEMFTLWHGVAFALIWTALAMYSTDTMARSAAQTRSQGERP